MNDDIFYQVALTLIPKVGAVTARNLMSYCGGARAVFEATEKELKGVPGIGAQLLHSPARRRCILAQGFGHRLGGLLSPRRLW